MLELSYSKRKTGFQIKQNDLTITRKKISLLI